MAVTDVAKTLSSTGPNPRGSSHAGPDLPYMATPVVFRFANANADEGGTWTYTLPFSIRVIDVWAIKTNSAGTGTETVQIKNGSSAITDAIALDTDATIYRATTYDDAYTVIARGGTLVAYFDDGNGANCDAEVYVMALPLDDASAA